MPSMDRNEVSLIRPAYKWLALITINLGNFVTPLDTGIMALILPTIASELRAPISLVLWVPLTTLVLEAALMPAFGRYSDSTGRKRNFVIGLALFALGAFLAGDSLTIFELILYRIFQAVGAAFVLSNGRAIITEIFTPRERGFALGTNISTLYVAITVGTVIAGSIVSVTQAVGWRYVFYFSGGLAAVDIPLSLAFLRESPKNPFKKTDWIGAILFVFFLGGLLTLLTSIGQNGLGNINMFIQEFRVPIFNIYFYPNALISIPIAAIGVVTVLSGVFFAFRELKFADPIITLVTFRTNRLFLSTNLAALFIYVGHWSTLTLLSFYFEEVQGLGVLTSGLLLTIEPLTVIVSSLLGGWIASHTGSRDPSIVGGLICAVALGLFTTISTTSDVGIIAFLLGMVGLGIGIFASGNTTANLGSVDASERATANGILGMMRFTGQSLSLAIGTFVVGYVALGLCVSQGCTFSPGQYVSALQVTFGLGSAICLLGVAATYLGREKSSSLFGQD